MIMDLRDVWVNSNFMQNIKTSNEPILRNIQESRFFSQNDRKMAKISKTRNVIGVTLYPLMGSNFFQNIKKSNKPILSNLQKS